MSSPVIAVDAMGGDYAPSEVVVGALQAVRELDVRLLLVGDKEVVAPLVEGDSSGRIEIMHASETIDMHDDPATSVRGKKDSSVVRAAEAVRDGRADAMVSAGNTGAAMAAALLRMGRIKGVARPAVAAPLPVPGYSTPTVLLDAGATVDCLPEWLVTFARMGAELAKARFGISEPRIGLLSNGEEEGKGDKLRKAAYPLLAGLPGFVGNVEGRDILSDRVDVVVTDGFTGNVALKAMEGTADVLSAMTRRVLDAIPEAGETTAAVRASFEDALVTVDGDLAGGGAMLLGVDGVCVISHGASSARAIVTAIRIAAECHNAGIVERLKRVVYDAG